MHIFPGKSKQGTEKKFKFPCKSCGALQTYAPGTKLLHCEYCGQDSPIVANPFQQIREYPFKEALGKLETALPGSNSFTIQCENCAAEFNFDENTHAGKCPFCGTPVVIKPGGNRQILPKSLIPFKVHEEEAERQFEQWVSGLWFAPNKVKKGTGDSSKLTGVYIPYWTYDSDTRTTYTGERGDAYQVSQQVMVTENGRRVWRTRMVTKVRWNHASGQVSRFFDDVLVGASKTLPRTITDKLTPWHMGELTAFNEAYLSGFTSEMYQVRLDDGFNTALRIMDTIIRSDVAYDIGGDFQRIHHLDTNHDRITYKHILLPVYSSAFRYGNKTYRFVVNGQTGKVQGERPYSQWKIAFAFFLGLGIVSGLLFLRTNM